MTWRWTTTSSALVGSSAMMILGRRQMAMAMQARCFMPPESSCGGRGGGGGGWRRLRGAGPRCAGVGDAGFQPAFESWMSWSAKASASWARMRMTGLSEFMEPCGTMAMPARRRRRMASCVQRREFNAIEGDAAAGDAAGGFDHAQDGQRHGGFAGAGFAGEAQALVGGEGEGDVVAPRGRRREGVGEFDLEALDFEDRGHADFRKRGLAISSRPTVTKNRPRKTRTMMTVGVSHHHHQPLIMAALKFTQ